VGAPSHAAAARVVDGVRAALRGPAFRCRPRKLLVRAHKCTRSRP
jgi:hypothetical protein